MGFDSVPRLLMLAMVTICVSWDRPVLAEDQNAAKQATIQQAVFESPIQKGSVELALLAGFGISHDLWEGEPGIRFLVLGARLGRVLSGPRGPGFLRGNLEIAGELLPAFLVDRGDTTYGFSATLLGRHHLMPGSRWRPYIVLGVGGLSTQQLIPIDTARFNFTLQAGLGISYALNERFVLTAEYRIHHISAGVKTATENPGINSSYIQFSVTAYRW